MVGQQGVLELGSSGDAVAPSDGKTTVRFVEVAVDAAGGGGARTYTYHVPERLADVQPGEAVLVEYGRRQALAVVLGDVVGLPDGATKPIVERVRADGPLLPPLSLALARWMSATYLAPPALVLRAMLPPGMLERLELVAELRPQPGVDGDRGTRGVAGGEGLGNGSAAGPEGSQDGGFAAPDADLLAQVDAGPRAVRDLVAVEGRPALMRRLRALAARDLISLDWTLLAATAGPRYERWITLSAAGRDALTQNGAQRLGPRQRAILDELSAARVGASGPDLGSRHGAGSIVTLARRGLVTVEIRERERRPLADRAPSLRGARPRGAALTGPQAEAVEQAVAAIQARESTPLLLDGVTGAGKTAIYVEAIAAALEAGRRALVLVPEIALALPLVDRLRADLAAEVALVHSGLGVGERADEWRRIRAGGAEIVVGTRLAVLAPLADVGLIVVDEEHDAAYKSDRTPRFQAREAALQLAALAGAAVILGSATPAVETVGRVRQGHYRRVLLPARPTGTAPTIEVVDLRAELAAGNRGLLSLRLIQALNGLEPWQGDRAILVINRRGSASVVLCRDCGAVQTCPECDRPLVFHQSGMTLRCHHCGRAAPMATRCPACGSARIRYLGGGTERVEREVRDRFPGLRVGRLDRDVVERKGAAERVIDAFVGGGLDVLVGTGLVAKGLDIPEVTLVGVVSADVALNLPDERAAERTYQLLAQAVGRAGRGDRPGLAIIQTYQPGHPAIVAVASANAGPFYDAELMHRERFESPPFGRLVKLTVALPDRVAAEREASAMAERLRARASERDFSVSVIGPAPAYIARRGDRWRWNLILRGRDPVGLLHGGLDRPWSVDVDPESLL